ncbi:MAG: 30S ribosomal protein S3 [Patescibacteria group bacterium]
MGQKIRPNSLRLGIIENWKSRWWTNGNFKASLEEDEAIRKVIRDRVTPAGIVRIEIERVAVKANAFRVFIKVAKPGLVIGRGGKGIEELVKAIEAKLRAIFVKRGDPKRTASVSLNIEELRRSEVSAQYVAQSIAWDLEKRMSGRRTMKRYLEFVMQNRDVQGAKVKLSGRIDGAEISRREMLSRGKLPLQTLRANIDYGEATAFSSYGTVGVKVWVYKGEVFERGK